MTQTLETRSPGVPAGIIQMCLFPRCVLHAKLLTLLKLERSAQASDLEAGQTGWLGFLFSFSRGCVCVLTLSSPVSSGPCAQVPVGYLQLPRLPRHWVELGALESRA